jgi:hypothetical protein
MLPAMCGVVTSNSPFAFTGFGRQPIGGSMIVYAHLVTGDCLSDDVVSCW